MNIISQTVPLQYDTGYSPFRADEFKKAAAFLEEVGFTGLELAVARPESADAELINSVVSARSLTVSTLSTGQLYGLDGAYLAAEDSASRNAAIAAVKGHIDLSSRLVGCPPVTIGLIRGRGDEGDAATLYENFFEAMKPCLEHAAKRGVILQIEPINGSELKLINTVGECLEFMARLGDPKELGLLYDTYHAALAEEDMFKALALCAERVTNVHFSDTGRKLPGEGEIDFPRVVAVLSDAGYTGAYALECMNIPSAEYVRARFPESMKRIFRVSRENKQGGSKVWFT